jgi:asparagine synthase (glutamine-hydrolysing)
VYGRLPAGIQRLLRSAVDRLPVDHRNFSLDFKAKQFLRGAAAPLALAHQRWLGSFDGGEIARLLAEPPGLDVEAEHQERAAGLDGAAGSLAQLLRLYQDTYLPDDILTKVDRASMACGLEVRAPFLDTELVDGVARLPERLLYARGEGKRLLRRAVAGRLPRSIRNRAKKGFGIPVGRWLRGPLGSMLDDRLGAAHLRRQGLFRPEAVARLVAEHREGRRDHRKPLWTLLMFQLWYDTWL